MWCDVLGSGGEKYTLDQGAVTDIRDVLAEQQRGIQALMQCVKDDFRDLDVIVKKIKDDWVTVIWNMYIGVFFWTKEELKWYFAKLIG